MTKKRQLIFDKYNGKCAYCGCELLKGWHADHIEPLDRHLLTKIPNRPEKDTIENTNPSCASYNNYKHSFSLGTFRKEISQLVRRLNEKSQYKTSKRYGLVIEVDKPVVFYFEQLANNK